MFSTDSRFEISVSISAKSALVVPDPKLFSFLAEITSYEIRQGNTYTDHSYIGKFTKDVLHDGKGLLVDGVRGVKPPSTMPSVWVGWNRNFVPQPYIVINLETLAALQSIQLASYVDIGRKIVLFSSCSIQFQRGKQPWSQRLSVCPPKHTKTGPAVVKIDLMGKDADRLKMTFNYSMDWLVLSEVTLNAGICLTHLLL